MQNATEFKIERIEYTILLESQKQKKKKKEQKRFLSRFEIFTVDL